MKEDILLNGLLAMARTNIKTYEAELQTEESGNKIARLQGSCAGFRKLEDVLESCKMTFSKTETKENIFRFSKDAGLYFMSYDYEVKTSEVNEMYKAAQVLKDLLQNNGVNDAINEAVEDRKDDLFFQSEKGRDLFFCRGWYTSISVIDNYIDAIEREYRARQQQNAEKLFDENE